MNEDLKKGFEAIDEITEIFKKNKISNKTAYRVLMSMLIALATEKKEAFKEEDNGESTSIEE